MNNKKSDFKRFCETTWIMVKYDVLPWMLGAGLVAALAIGIRDAEAKEKLPQPTNLFQKQR